MLVAIIQSTALRLAVLHDVANNVELVKVSTTTFRAKRLLECDLSFQLAESRACSSTQTDLNVVDILPGPVGAHEQVAKAKDKQVLDHLLPEIMVNAEDLLLFPVGLKGSLQFTRALQILAERLLDLRGCLVIK